MPASGYSAAPLFQKLGIKDGFRIRVVHAPDHYLELLDGMPERVKFLTDPLSRKDLVHFFTVDIEELHQQIASLKNEIFPNGSLWVSWPKKASRLAANISENQIRDLALPRGLVDVKVCSIDEPWSALKLVIPLKDRNKVI